ncbi:uncharacterized protein DUF4181 [Paenibacillus taihuensis]|uniref:Uncharacterized protein DUF4181 n=1 Tax=Paenibacillus taihuensis TaxID=1156355 RepID=A0A3D9RHF7_9BACL|nr:uncharacterized protein DUF4181 [Paenibacillus taihuensis]
MTYSIPNIQSTVLSMSLLLLLLIILELIVKKYLLVKEPNKISDTNGKSVNRWVKGLLAIISFIVFFFVLDTTNINALKWFWLALFIVSMGQHTFMEWRYLKGSKEYIISLLKLAVGLIYILIFIF